MLVAFNLSHYEVTFYYLAQSNKKDGAMEIEVDIEYLRGSIAYTRLVRALWKLGDRKQIRQILCHEISHILTEQLWTSKSTRTNNEQVTEHVSRLLFRLYERKK